MQYDVRKFGAVADGETNTTSQLQAAIDACGLAGGGTVVFPAGQYVTGTLWLRSNVTLHLEAGAVLLGSQRFDDFPKWSSKWEGPGVKQSRAALICSGDKSTCTSSSGRKKCSQACVTGRPVMCSSAMT